MKCPKCKGKYADDEMGLFWVHELCGERVSAWNKISKEAYEVIREWVEKKQFKDGWNLDSVHTYGLLTFLKGLTNDKS